MIDIITEVEKKKPLNIMQIIKKREKARNQYRNLYEKKKKELNRAYGRNRYRNIKENFCIV